MPDFNDYGIGNIIVYLWKLLGWWIGSLGVPEPWVTVIVTLVAIVSLATMALLIPIFTIWLERKLAARFQDRLGPNRAGPYGLLQSFADVIKLLGKEDITPTGADKIVYNLAPLVGVLSVVTLWAVVPLASTMVGARINVGVLYVIGISGLGTIAIMMGGWSSNNKFALLGAFRTVAQLVAYEVPMIVALMVPVLLAGSMNVADIVERQDSMWYLWMAPIAAALFFITSVAEIGRAPFDLLEAESEIVAGYHIEYTGMKFGMWMLTEFLHAFTIAALTATLFLGGWNGPFAKEFPLLGLVYFFIKTFAVYFVVVWSRSTFPRIRIDHLLSLNWKFFTPLALGALVVTSLVMMVMNEFAASASVMARTVTLFAANVALLWFVFELIRRSARQARAEAEGGHDEEHASHGGDGHHDEHGHAPASAH
ncbi:MAG: NADH-quinone oxidoreductase subunit NuoH [Chloroflexi bacterium]|nr:NADH-quinone oxidoreductase subunit NuoH [Chloroflexota bacterium]